MTAPDKPRRRRLSGEDHVLWRTVTRSVAPLKRKYAAPPDDAEPAQTLAQNPAPNAVQHKGKAAPVVRAPAAPKAALKAPPPLAPIERRLKQRLARGQVEIDARLDLHGRTQHEAHGALVRFLHRAQSNGAKTVLVITGKGDAAEGRGVLKRQVPLWLASPELRGCVLGVEVAHRTHGGAGALYVRLRRGR
jgi:DNA-nicking Smr family endonuclease